VQPWVQAITRGAVCWLACAPMRKELEHMLGHRSVARWAPDAPAALAVFDRWARQLPTPCTPAAPRLRCTDPDDQVFVDLSLAEGVRWLLSHDRALLRLARKARALNLCVAAPGDVAAPP
jgi:predicted nucleic acid-binding protein